jgi:hypothetical protein
VGGRVRATGGFVEFAEGVRDCAIGSRCYLRADLLADPQLLDARHTSAWVDFEDWRARGWTTVKRNPFGAVPCSFTLNSICKADPIVLWTQPSI